MIRLIFAFLFLCTPITANAEEWCKDSKTQPISEMRIPFNTTWKEAKKKLRASYRGTATIDFNEDTQFALVSYKQSKRSIFDMHGYAFRAGRLHMVTFSYSNRFQEKLGGIAEAFRALASKLIERFDGEKADDVSQEGAKVVAIWNSHPIHVELSGKDPNAVLLRFQCRPLADHLSKKASESVNMGF